MTDKKLNVLDRIFGVFKTKKEPQRDIVSQADRVIEEYIYNKNKLIHRKCKSQRRSERLFAAMVVGSSLGMVMLVLKIFAW